MRAWLVKGLLLLGCWAVCVSAQETHAEQATSLAVSVASDAQGRLLQVQVRQGQVWLSVSEDAGKHFSPPVAVNGSQMNIVADGEIRPKVAVAANGNIYVSWSEALKKPFVGAIWFARSLNGGKSFEPAYIVHQDKQESMHRHDELQIAADGTLTLFWVDMRDALAARAVGKPYDGAAIYYVVSTDMGKHFLAAQKLADNSCDCCRIATASKPDGTVAVLWRHVFAGGERDHAMAEIKPGTKPVLVRASYGHWKMNGCPQHGAALAMGEGFGYHLAYFDGAGDRPGLRIARMDGEAWVTSPPKRFGDNRKNAGYPALYSLGDKVWLAWREQGSNGMEILSMASLDGGKTWNSPSVMLRGAGKLDYPFWLSLQGQVVLVINTAERGLQVLPFTSLP
ncbi:sialidase family protein [Methylophilus aquaticus]|uniref:Sialidase family protein n=1 Tax=Methylophilus aquaticus TaxID=1971610 RepID=A0ABT9JS20_9PROT|nr:sialidase family protein [Methylophilus aquaticus]MDP8567363.1 sialidase family protein [Methylophilus aquaticus]